MLNALLHRAIEIPAVDNWVQSVLGSSAELERRLAAKVGRLPQHAIILDVGGGSGLPSSLWPAGATYVCLDLDASKLATFRRKNGSGVALIGDGTAIPFGAGSVDLVVCKNTTHHLSDDQLPVLFRECARVLKPGRRLLLLDAVKAPDRLQSRLLWRYDRGSHPRPIDTLRQAAAQEFEVEDWEVFATHHRYVLGVGVAR